MNSTKQPKTKNQSKKLRMDNTGFADEYNVEAVQLIHPPGRDFMMYVTPRYRLHYEERRFESFTADLLARILTRARLFIDVGAHYGFFTLLAATGNRDLEIIALEPTPETCAVLERNVQHIGASNVSIRRVAVSDSAGSAPYTIASTSDNCGFYSHPNSPPLRTIEVETTTIDALLKDRPPCPAVVKIDTDGHELAILKGMSETLQRFSDVTLIIEFNPKMQRASGHEPEVLLNELDRFGFAAFLLDDQERRAYRLKPDSDWSQLMDPLGYANLYCVPRDRALSVCFFSHTSNMNGAERSLLELVDELVADHGTICTVVLPSDGPLVRRLEQAGASCIITSPTYSWWCHHPRDIVKHDEKVQGILDSIRAVITGTLPILTRIDPDIIWTQTMVIPWGAMVAGLMSKPHAWAVREFGDRITGLEFFYPFEQILSDIDTSSAIIFPCIKEIEGRLFPNVPPERLKTLYTHVPVPPMPALQTQAEYFKIPGAVKLGVFGYICSGKGQADAVMATAELLARGWSVELLLAGSEDLDYRRQIEEIIHDYNLEDRVRLPGFLDNPYPAIFESDIVIICSRSETFCRIAVEAMLLGRPVVYSAAGGFVEYMIDGKTGLSYAPGDISGLVERLEKLLRDADFRAQLGDFSRTYALDKFTRDAYGGETFRTLLKLRENSSKATIMPSTIKSEVTASIASLCNDYSQISTELNQLNEKAASPLLQLDQRTREVSHLNEEETDLQARLDQHILEVSRLNDEIEDLRARLDLGTFEIGSLHARLNQKEGTITNLKIMNKRLVNEIKIITSTKLWKLAVKMRKLLYLVTDGPLRTRRK